MALAIDSQESGGTAHRATTASLSWTFNNVAGNLLVVGAVVTNSAGAGAPTVSGITYNGVAMASIVNVGFGAGSESHVYIFALANPATGSNTVTITGTNTAATNFAILGGAISFSGANTSAPTGTTSTNNDGGGTGTHATAGSITAASGNYVFGVGGWGTGAATSSVDHASTFTLVGSSSTSGDDIATDIAQSSGAGINAGFSWTPADHWGMVAAEIQATGAAGNTFQPRRMPLGV